ncbi:hypothetical protein A8F94_03335 [Bacillus sp. FJAT-27225]|uniref:YitT family protein n=1 Tax=Bacillus sp. FJAT-27225 TaxID=1743144 RepID=UPI00080C230C|nr:YitT family protein [Bacillus sp. FJAT-27225]OCA90914.1 hypothetical protein A8F94_03335 [Bacillus sp. FJAT-27225]
MIKGLKVKNILLILLGTAIMAFGVINFNIQNQLAEGGVTGITILIYFLFNFDPAYSNLIINIPIFFLGYKLLGRRAFIYTIIGTVGLSVFLWIFQRIPLEIPLRDDMFLAALFAGLFIGVGLGIIFRFGGTSGGVDIIARIAQKYWGISMGRTMFMFDALVILASFLTYLDYREAMYTLVAVAVGARVIDVMAEGAYSARGAMIMSEKYDEIAERIMKEMDRGVTVLKGYGYYSKKEREVLYCVVPKSEIIRLKNVITAVDPHAFVSVTAVHDVLGEGFTLDANKNPFEV